MHSPPPSLASSVRIPRRVTGWSSASSTRIGVGLFRIAPIGAPVGELQAAKLGCPVLPVSRGSGMVAGDYCHARIQTEQAQNSPHYGIPRAHAEHRSGEDRLRSVWLWA